MEKLKKIESFEVNHTKLLEGLYVSRKDYNKKKDTVIATTFDIRMKRPNNIENDYLSTGALHAIEHLGATYLRHYSNVQDITMYFGPMGCRTGFYVMFQGNLTSQDILDEIINMFEFIAKYEGEVPGADPFSCGNYKDMDLETAKLEAVRYLDVMKEATFANFTYPI